MGIGFRELIVAGIVVALYLAPYFIASTRKHPQKTPIFILNLLLGWTLLGWVGALIWAFWNHKTSGSAN